MHCIVFVTVYCPQKGLCELAGGEGSGGSSVLGEDGCQAAMHLIAVSWYLLDMGSKECVSCKCGWMCAPAHCCSVRDMLG